MRRGAVLAEHGHHRQPPVDARAAGRRRARRRDVRVEIAGRVDRGGRLRALRRAYRRRCADRDRGEVRDQQRGPRRAGARAPHARARSALGAAAVSGARQLFQPVRALAVQASGLPDARPRRARRTPDARPRRPGTLRPGRRMDRHAELRRRSGPRARVLRIDPRILARPAGRRAAARVRGHPAEARRARRAGRRLRRAGCGAAWRARAGEPVRHRVAGADRVARARAARRRDGLAQLTAAAPAAACDIPRLSAASVVACSVRPNGAPPSLRAPAGSPLGGRPARLVRKPVISVDRP
ncbi:protein of unknown function [Burkholderia multivorans]